MKPFITALLISHVAAGTIALLVGLVPMLAKKGGKLHNRAGLVYVWCMIYVAASAMLLCVLQEFKLFRLFLAGIAVFSFYLSFTGWRAVLQKRAKTGPMLTDKLITYGTMVVSVGMIGFGAWLLYLNGPVPLAVIFTFFGGLTFNFARRDFVQFNKPQAKMHWFFLHFTRMAGSYIAAFTAFLVNNMYRMVPANSPDWVEIMGWIAPSIIGTVLITRTVIAYRRKFQLA
jgi:uncharacterized membrane protein